jgi:cell division protein FtsA
VHIITGLITAAQNVFKCVKRAGLEVSDIVLEPLASSYAVLDDEEKEVGVVLLDIGGGTTDLAIFEGRTIRHIAVIGIAGKRVTDDIRKGLGILTEQAERLKKEYGYAYLPDIVDDEVISIPGIGGRSPIEINKSLLCRIVQPRMEEILEIVALEIKRSGYSRHLFAGAVLTGGGSLIKGIDKLSRDILGMPVKIGIPTGFHAGLVKEVENPMFATGVGLVLHAIRYRNQSAVTFKSLEKKNRGLGSVFTRIRSWFEEL